MGDQATLHGGSSTVQQEAELSLWKEPPQHLLSGPGAEPPGRKQINSSPSGVSDNVEAFSFVLELGWRQSPGGEAAKPEQEPIREPEEIPAGVMVFVRTRAE